VNFNTASIGTYLFMRDGTQFHGPVDFSDASIGANLDARPNASDRAPLGFDDAVKFKDVTVGKGVYLDGARFLSTRAPASFYGMKVGGDFEVSRAQFGGPADFTHLTVTGEMALDGTVFSNPLKTVNFNTANIGTYVFMRDATEFHGPVDFKGATI